MDGVMTAIVFFLYAGALFMAGFIVGYWWGS